MLVIDCCIRGDLSDTRRFYKAYLEKRGICNPQIIYLNDLKLKSFDKDMLILRDKRISEQKFDDEIFSLAKTFKNADEIIIAAPFWDLSFPSALKVFFEHICVSGLTFGYTDKGPQGFCNADKMLYFTTCGGFVGERHLGFEYAKAVSKMLGIENSELYIIEGLDIDPLKRKEIVKNAIVKLS